MDVGCTFPSSLHCDRQSLQPHFRDNRIRGLELQGGNYVLFIVVTSLVGLILVGIILLGLIFVGPIFVGIIFVGPIFVGPILVVFSMPSLYFCTAK